MRTQPNQRGRFCERLQDAPAFVIQANSDYGKWLIAGEGFARFCIERVFDGKRIHLALDGGGVGLLFCGTEAGRPLSNLGTSRNLIGAAGGSADAVFVCTGSTIRGVTKTMSSLLLRLIERERKRLPRTGISPMPGILLSWTVARLSSRPAIPNDCPSLNSISVSARRVEIAGTVNPLI